MNRTTHQVRNALALMILAAAPKLFAQAAPVPAAPAASADSAEETIILDPFSVSAADEKSGYAVKDTLAGTRVRTDMKDIVSSVVVVNKQLMQDIGATNNETLLQYTGNTEVGGVRGNFLGGSYPSSADRYGQTSALLRPSNNTRVRGLDSADNTRDFFMSEIPWDSYVVDRVDIQRGPNSILFGVGSPAGIINSSVNQASFKSSFSIENRIDSWGSFRNSIDINKVLLKQTLAFRIAAVDDRRKFEQKPAHENTSRFFGAVRYEPRLIEGGNTSIRVNFEHGDISANRPRTLTPEDTITPWFTAMNKAGFNPSINSPISQANGQNPWIKDQAVGRQYWPGAVAYYPSATGTDFPLMLTPLISERYGRKSDGSIDNEIGGQIWTRMFAITNYKQWAINSGKSDASYVGTKSLSDPSIFNFYENLIDGENKHEWQRWNAANVSLSQSLWDNRLGLNLVYDYQRYEDGQENIFNGGGAYAISVDVNTHYIDGSPNPNFGKPYVAGDTASGGTDSFIDRDGLRFTPYGELRFTDLMEKSWVTDLLGRHVFTGLLSRDIKVQRDRAWALDMADAGYPAYLDESQSFSGNVRNYNWQAYLGDTLSGASSASGANMSRLRTRITSPEVANVRFFDSHWNVTGVAYDAPYTYTDAEGVVQTSTQSENPANYVGWSSRLVNYKSSSRGDKAELMTGDGRKRHQVDSQGLTWQGYLLGDNFVPVFGWRKDTVRFRSGTDSGLDNLGIVDGKYTWDPAKTTKEADESKSWGAMLHMPRSWAAKLPGNTRISVFYNRSQNFKADEPRMDVFGQIIPNPQAKTKEYGFLVSTLDERLSLKVNWFETKMANATLPYGIGFSYQQWAYPAWYVAHARRYSYVAAGNASDPSWDWTGFQSTQMPATTDLNTILTAAKAIPLDQRFFDTWGGELADIDIAAFKAGKWMDAWQGYDWWRADPQKPRVDLFSRVASADTTSKGVEVDLTAQLLKNWNLTLNVSKVKAQYDGVSSSVTKYMDDMTAFFATPAGDLRMWGEDWADNSFRKKWDSDVLSSWRTLQAYLGNSAPEVAPWRTNLITTYTFQDGALKNLYVGGGYRWEDRKILGYALTNGVPDAKKPLKGDSEDHFDLWVGYSRKLGAKVNWKIQLNARNLFEDHHLVAATKNPDGSVALARIVEGMSFQLTNTFSF